ncbi:MAG: NIPSNAP family protein [Xanthobacteraceae bacterium]
MAEHYEIATVTVRPGTHPQALAVLEKTLAGDPSLLACWYCEIGALNRILVIRKSADAAVTIERRLATLGARSPLGIGEFIADLSLDTYVSFDFMPQLQPGVVGPCFEVRSYGLKPDGLAPTIELWRKAVPARAQVSPLLAAMVAVTGAAIRFLHIWPYKTVDERARLRQKAVADGVWPPPGGPGYLVSQQADIYLPAAFSPIR